MVLKEQNRSHTKSPSYQYLNHQSADPLFEYSLKILTRGSRNEIRPNPIEVPTVRKEKRAQRTWHSDCVYLTTFKQHINLELFVIENELWKSLYV